MFDIEYKGANCVVLSTKKSSLVVDPKLSLVGLKDVKVKDAVELATEDRFSVASSESKLNIEGPGEYGISEFDIKGIAAQRHIDTESDPRRSTIYRVEVGDVRLAFIGNIYEKLSEEQLEDIGVIDILVIPVGGNGYTLDPTGAASLARQIDPKVVIPVHYSDPAVKYEVPQEDLELFTKELGAPVEETAKYKVKASVLPQVLTVINVSRT